MKRPIVVLGAGYGGLTAARALGQALRDDPEHPVILVDAHDYHELKPKIPEAIGEWTDCAVQVPLRDIVDDRSVTFVQARIAGVDLRDHTVQTANGPVSYWRLVWALGGQPDLAPGGQAIPGLAETAIAPYSHGQACRLRHHLGALVQQAARIPSSVNRRPFLTVVVAGAGFVGVELAGELGDRLASLAQRHDLALDETRVVLVEPKSVLPGFGTVLARTALATLQAKGVEVRLGVGIAEAHSDRVVLTDGSAIATRTLVWAAGMRGHALAKEAGFIVDDRGRIHADAFLRSRGALDVYAIGDSAHLMALELRPDLTYSAQAAVDQGEFVAGAVLAEIKGRKVEPYRPRGKGVAILLGNRSAIARVGRFAPLRHLAPWLKQIPTIEHLWKLGGARLVARHLDSTFLPLVAPRLVDRYRLAGDAMPTKAP